MLRKILSQVFNYEKTMERRIPGEKTRTNSVSNTDTQRRSEKSQSGMGSSGYDVRLQEKVPDPWDDPLM
jgi:hypothetical protein